MESGGDRRLIRVDAHDDGLNRWEMARLRPAAALAGAIDSYSDYWEVTGGFTARREMPGIEPVLIINLGEPIGIVGGDGREIKLGSGEGFAGATHTRSAISRSNGAQRGVHVHMPLLTMKRLLGIPLHELADRAVALGDLGAWGAALTAELVEARSPIARAAVLDRHLWARLADAPEERPEIAHAVAMLAHRPDVRIDALARDLGWSRKQLGRRVREATGVGPRLFRRLARFSRLVARLQRRDTGSWAELALDGGWFDQPHMLRDFRDFAGVTPREYLARSMPNMGGVVEG
ncbi:MAG TPA: helix-turn-helix domain-containing protein [Allosphingosinicella sp.]|jgi:AraC-like DNA-binding protein|nr:helix-turn-helix domain-containing protein [Allosphingosinicella sp.]